jgi:hypothetical protein
LFSGCSPRSYRDVGFQLQSEDEGGHLVWLPNVRGLRIIADTNGSYRNELVRTCDDLVGSLTVNVQTRQGHLNFT